MIFYPAMNSVGTWFFKRRAFAFGVMAAGSSLGGVHIPFNSTLQEYRKLTNTSLIGHFPYHGQSAYRRERISLGMCIFLPSIRFLTRGLLVTGNACGCFHDSWPAHLRQSYGEVPPYSGEEAVGYYRLHQTFQRIAVFAYRARRFLVLLWYV